MSERHGKSEELLARAERAIPLGSQTFSKSRVQYPLGAAPLFVTHGRGAHVFDVDGHEYLDLVCGLASVLLGYCDPDVGHAVAAQLACGVTFSLAHPLECEVAERIIALVPCAEQVRFAKNGSDATAAAVRLARPHTGREHVAVCGYHVVTHDVAAVVLEPMNVAFPSPGFLPAVRALCDRHGAVLVFDETVTGFRFARGGAQELFGVTPDLATFGKGLANGLPLSVVAGRRDLMRGMEEIFFSTTFGGETLALAAVAA